MRRLRNDDSHATTVYDNYCDGVKRVVGAGEDVDKRQEMGVRGSGYSEGDSETRRERSGQRSAGCDIRVDVHAGYQASGFKNSSRREKLLEAR